MTKGRFCYFTSSIGRKFLMAVSGLGIVGFVVAHLLGNLQIFRGPDAINSYAVFLKNLGPALWFARLGMVSLLGIHFWAGMSLAAENKAARPKSYEFSNTIQADIASRTMKQTGLLILAFVVVHLAHFTFCFIQPESAHFLDSQGRHDVYRMLVSSFRVGYFVIAYIVAILCVGLHLSHALSSFLQTFGMLYSKRMYEFAHTVAVFVSILVSLGYISIPLSIYLGFVTL